MLSIITLAVLTANPLPAGPPCQSPPDGASAAVIDCFDDACDQYKKDWNNCDTPNCRTQATAEYIIAINVCVPHLAVAPAGWASIWYMGDRFGVSIETAPPKGAVVFMF